MNQIRFWTQRIKAFLRDESGPTAVEYAIMLAMIILVSVSTLQALGNTMYQSLWTVVDTLE